MYWHQSTMARPSQMAIRSPQHKCPNRDSGRLQGRSATVVSPQWHTSDIDHECRAFLLKGSYRRSSDPSRTPFVDALLRATTGRSTLGSYTKTLIPARYARATCRSASVRVAGIAWYASETFEKEGDGGLEGAKLACRAVGRFIAVTHENPRLAAPFLTIMQSFNDLAQGSDPPLFSTNLKPRERERSRKESTSR
jgi:hypothetical protein